MGGSSVLVEAVMLAGRAIWCVVRRDSRAVSREVRVAMDIVESELRLERDIESGAWSRQNVPIESSSSPMRYTGGKEW